MNGPVEPGRQRLEHDVLHPLVQDGSNTIGISSRNEKRAAASRSRPLNLPLVMVIPERDVPGISARICVMPIEERRAGREPLDALALRPGPRATAAREDREEDRDLPRLAEVLLDLSSPSAPAIAAGIVAKKTPHAMRSSIVSTVRRRTEPNQAAT